MRHLTPRGLSKDGTKLVLVSDEGEEFSVAVDHKLRTALRGDQPRTGARTGHLEKKMESALRPRDIQMRIRAGESAEDVAGAAGTSVEAIMAFAGPVLAERAHVADSAQKSSIRRRQGEAPVQHRTLADAAASYFSSVKVKVDDVEWDAWRRDDGRWTLTAAWEAGNAARQAQFTFDQRGRYVVADDEAARVLTGEVRPEAVAGPAQPQRRLSSVPMEDELPLGDEGELGSDAIALVREREVTVPRPEPVADAEPEAAAEPEPVHHEEPTADLSEAVEAAREQASERPAAADEEPAGAPAPKRKGRASVPSWDEIMFGGGKQD